jgi:hypothetical protein
VLATKPNVVVTIDDRTLKQTDCFKYFGGAQVANGSSLKEIKRRIQIANQAFRTNKNMLRCRSFTYAQKKILYNIHVMPAMLYGSETWTVRREDWDALKSMHLSHLLTMCRKSRIDHISYAKLLKRFQMDATVEAIVSERRLRFFHRIMNMGWNRLPKRVLYSVVGVSTARHGGANYKSNFWGDLQKFALADKSSPKMSVDWKEGLPEWRTAMRQDKDRWSDTVRGQRDIFMVGLFFYGGVVGASRSILLVDVQYTVRTDTKLDRWS